MENRLEENEFPLVLIKKDIVEDDYYLNILNEIRKSIITKNKKIARYIRILINIIDIKDQYTSKHTERVVMYAKLLEDKLNLSDKDKLNLIYAAYIHDIGKINIPKEILIKDSPLTNAEWLQIKEHSEIGFNIIKNIDVLKDIAPIVLHHHERYDGLGYPDGLKGDDIPYLSRVLNVIDSFDAMTSKRTYNTQKSFEEGIEELIRCRNSQFDPNIVEVFIENINKPINLC